MAIGKIYIADVFLKIGGTSSQYLMSDGSVSNSSNKANVDSPTFTGTVILPTTTSIGNVSSTELSYIDGVTSGIQAQLNSKLTIVTGTTNFLPKVTGTNIFGNSRILDDGTYIGIGTTNAPTKDIALGNQTNREIGIEESSNTVVGRDLVIMAGRTINYLPNSNFIALNQTPRTYSGIWVTPSKDIYVVTFSTNNNIYKATYPSTTLISIGTATNNQLTTITVAPNGDVYVGGLYTQVQRQVGGVGSFNVIGSYGSNSCQQVYAHTNGDVYLALGEGSGLYKQTFGGTTFSFYGLSGKSVLGVSVAPNGDIYSSTSDGDIYKQTGGTGSFVPMGLVNNNYRNMTITPAGNLYINTSGTIYVLYNCTTPLVLVSSGLGTKTIASDSDGSLYSSNADWYINGDILYQNNNSLGTPDLGGGIFKVKAGTGKGTGDSNFEVYTGQKLPSGTDMQISTLRAKINNEGLMTLPSVTNALITADVTGKAVITKEYLTSINEPLQIVITATSSITTDTLDLNGKGQSGKNVIIDNGSNAINITVNGGIDFVASYLKHGTASVTFIQGSGRTLIQVDGTAVFNGSVGSTSAITSVGGTDYLRISNA